MWVGDAAALEGRFRYADSTVVNHAAGLRLLRAGAMFTKRSCHAIL